MESHIKQTILLVCLSFSFLGNKSFAQDWSFENLLRYQGSGSFEEYGYSGAVGSQPDHPLSFTLNTLLLSSWIDERLQQLYETRSDFEVVESSSREIVSNLFSSPSIETYIGKKVLSIGEGFDVFMPYLREKGVFGAALDICYTPYLKNYTGWANMYVSADAYRNYLIGEDVGKLGHLVDTGVLSKYKKQISMIVSHNLFDYLDEERQIHMLVHSLRLLEKGGTFRANFASTWVDLKSKLQEEADKFGISYQWIYVEGESHIAYKSDDFDVAEVARGFSKELLRKYEVNLESELKSNGVAAVPFHYAPQWIVVIKKTSD